MAFLTTFLQYSNFKHYVLSPIDVAAQWAVLGGMPLSGSLARGIEAVKNCKSVIGAFEVFTKIPSIFIEPEKKTKDYLTKNKDKKALMTYDYSDEESQLLRYGMLGGWAYSVTECLTYLTKQGVISLGSKFDKSVGWMSSIGGGLYSFQNLRVTMTAMRRLHKDNVIFSNEQLVSIFCSVAASVAGLGLAIVYSPACSKYDLDNTKLYVMTGFVASRLIGFVFDSYIKSKYQPVVPVGKSSTAWSNMWAYFKTKPPVVRF